MHYQNNQTFSMVVDAQNKVILVAEKTAAD